MGRLKQAMMRPSYICFRARPNDFRTELIQPENARLSGDYNANGVVDASDYTVWRDKTSGTGFLTNDATPGTISDDDYDVWKANFGLSMEIGSAAVAGSAVPEPQSLAMLLLAGTATAILSRYRSLRLSRAFEASLLTFS